MKTSALVGAVPLALSLTAAAAAAEPKPIGPVGVKLTPVLATTTTISGQRVLRSEGHAQSDPPVNPT